MNNFLGANWRTTLSGWIALLASAIAINPGLVGFLPGGLRGYITGIAGLMAIVSGGTFAAHAKDKQVTGGSVPNDSPKSGAGPLTPLVLILSLLAVVSGCSTLARWQANPKVQTAETLALEVVENSALNAGLSAIEQYAASGKVDGRAVGAAALNGVAYQLRTLESTSSASNSSAIAAAVQDGSGIASVSNSVAPIVASAVQVAVQQGVKPDVAVEKAATALDAAAAKASE